MQSITIQFLKYNRKPWQSYMNSAESIENQFFFFLRDKDATLLVPIFLIINY